MLWAICHAHWRLVSRSRMCWWLWSELTLEHNLLRSRLSSESKLLWLLTYPKSNLRFWNRKLRLSACLSSNIRMSHNLLSGIHPWDRYLVFVIVCCLSWSLPVLWITLCLGSAIVVRWCFVAQTQVRVWLPWNMFWNKALHLDPHSVVAPPPFQDGGAHNRRSGFSLSRQNGVFVFFVL